MSAPLTVRCHIQKYNGSETVGAETATQCDWGAGGRCGSANEEERCIQFVREENKFDDGRKQWERERGTIVLLTCSSSVCRCGTITLLTGTNVLFIAIKTF